MPVKDSDSMSADRPHLNTRRRFNASQKGAAPDVMNEEKIQLERKVSYLIVADA